MKSSARDTRDALALSRARPGGRLRAARGAARVVLLACAASCAASCADPGSVYRREHPGWTPQPPRAGMSLEETLASLYVADAGPGAAVEEIRVLRVDAKPWRSVSWEALRKGRYEPGPGERYAVLAHRYCRSRVGLTLHQAERASWFLFSGSELTSFDHTEFVARCGIVHHFRPSEKSDLPLERGLIRFAAQRYPTARPTDAQRAAMGLAYLDVDRLDEAEAILGRLDRELSALAASRRQARGDKARNAYIEQENELRAHRNELAAGITT